MGSENKQHQPETLRAVRSIVDSHYDPSDYPAVAQQIERWQVQLPLAGCTVIDATPIFTNTLVKYLALLSGGANLIVSEARGIPADQRIVEQLRQIGIPVWLADTEEHNSASQRRDVDVIMDCAGTHSSIPVRGGYVELTRSGVAKYRTSPKPVFCADSGRLKVLETSLGTGDGYIRAMRHFGQPVSSGKSVVIFGCGKVGYGVMLASRKAGAHVTIIDLDTIAVPEDVAFIPSHDTEAVQNAIASAWCVVSATGVKGGLDQWAEALVESPALLANVGAEDEFGDQVSPSRVLFDKVPINFALDEPTRLRFIDPIMALSNEGARDVLRPDAPSGIFNPPETVERAIFQSLSSGSIAPILDEHADDLGLRSFMMQPVKGQS